MNQRSDADGRDIVLGQGLAPIPERLLLAHAQGEVLFVVGAGVSIPAGLPDFRGLVTKVYKALDPALYSVISNKGHGFPKLNARQKAEFKRFKKDEYDVVLGMLERRLEGEASNRNQVRQKVGEILRCKNKPAPIHRHLMRLADRRIATTIITTNFDLLLENAARNIKSPVQTYALGGIPRPTLRQDFNGVLHIHGALDRNPKRTSDIIISDQDLGEFYLRRRIVPDLIYDAARLYNLVLVGYSANDPPMRYLLNAVAADVVRFSDLKERFIFVGMDKDDPIELADWKARGITPIQYKIQDDDHSQLYRTLAQWAELSAINGNKSRVDRELKKIVKIKSAEASKEIRASFDHFIRRSNANERIRLSKLVSKHKADLGWLDAILEVSSEDKPGEPLMRLFRLPMNERDYAMVLSTVAFLDGRLEKKETIEWALRLGPGDIVKRRAIMELLDTSGIHLSEPWLSAWRLIEEFWDAPVPDFYGLGIYDVQKRLQSGERSGTLISAIVDLVAPRLSIETRKFPKRPKTFHDLFQARLTSGELVDPAFLGLQKLTEGEFLISLANELDVAVMRGLDIARRVGQKNMHLLLNRVYYVSESERSEEVNEPDKYSQGIAPSVKLLHAVVARLVAIDCSTALDFISRWKRKDSPIHLRLWAAMSCDSRITSATDTDDFILGLDSEVFWDVQHHPEIAELRARRFSELDDATQKAITRKIRRGPSRKMWPKNVDADRIEEYRLYWAVRELKRIEVAGATLPRRDKTWLESKSNIGRVSELAEMHLDEGFLQLSKIQNLQANPDHSLDLLEGVDRLREMEQKLSAPHRGWDDDPASGASAWIKEKDNSVQILADIEATADGGADFPKVWEVFGWVHSPPEHQGQETPVRDLPTETDRVLDLIAKLPNKTLSAAIEGISHWLRCWEKYVVAAPNWSAVWLRIWPLAVEQTNAMQPPKEEPDLNVVEQADPDKPHYFDTLNIPAGKLVGVFLEACPNLAENPRPFDDPSDLRKMRDLVINASGRSGLIAKHRMIESLEYFLSADKEWTKENLIRPLRADDDEALALWRAVGSRTQFKKVLKIIGGDMVDRATDSHLDRETRHSLAFSLVIESLHALRKARKPAVEQSRVQQMIRSLEDAGRAKCAEAITRFVSDLSEQSDQVPEHLFQSAAKPFLQQVWPQELSLRSPGISTSLATLPAIARGEFAEAVNTIERFLVPFECWSILDYELYNGKPNELYEADDGKPRLSMIDDEAKAKALLHLLDRTIGTAENAVVPHNLGDALEQVRTVAPNLTRTPKYRRLETADRRVR